VRLLFFALAPPVALWFAVMGLVPMERNSALIALAIVVVPVSLVALGSSETAARQWAAYRGARFAPGGVDQLRRHLGRTRVARTLGVTIGFSLNFMLVGRYNADPDAFTWFSDTWNGDLTGWWLSGLGYVLGSWWAEATKPRDRLGEDASAAILAPRRLGDYLDANVRFMLWLFAGLMAVSVVLWQVGPQSDLRLRDEFPWQGLVVSSGTAALAMLLAVWTCRRRELVADDAALAYEELTRAATVNALGGVAVAMMGEFAGRMLGAPRDGQTLSAWFQLAGTLVVLLGVGYWIACGTKFVFRTRRIDALRSAASAA